RRRGAGAGDPGARTDPAGQPDDRVVVDALDAEPHAPVYRMRDFGREAGLVPGEGEEPIPERAHEGAAVARWITVADIDDVVLLAVVVLLDVAPAREPRREIARGRSIAREAVDPHAIRPESLDLKRRGGRPLAPARVPNWPPCAHGSGLSAGAL